MRRSSLGKISIGFAVFAGVLFALHFGNVIPVLNTVFAPLISLFGGLLGLMGYFERDKKRLPALVGILMNTAFLGWWIVLLVMSIAK